MGILCCSTRLLISGACLKYGHKHCCRRVCLVNEEGNVLLDKFVRPREAVTDFRTQFSGIRPESFADAEEFDDVQMKVARMLEGRILVGHSIQHDLQVSSFDKKHFPG